MKVPITDGAGYTGSTVASTCEDAGHNVVILDDFFTGRCEFIDEHPLYKEDIVDGSLLDRFFGEQRIDAVVHCVARIVAPKSVSELLAYYENNVAKIVTLPAALQCNGVERFLFSSSASIYTPDENFVVTEDSPLQPGSPYVRTRFMVELILEDFTRVGDVWVVSLCYFNPIDIDPKLCNGQQLEKPSHVLTKLLEAWVDKEVFTVTGVDWPTRDGSGIHDFIHVWDLARVHIIALERFDEVTATGPYQIFNIGIENGVTVKELVASFEKITGDPLKARFGGPRPGDIVGVYTVSIKAKDVFGWKVELAEIDAIRDAIVRLPI